MKKLNATLSTLILALLSLILSQAALAQQPPDDVQGNWTIYSTSIKDGSTVIKHVQIAQYGNRITGYFEGPDQSGPIQGEVKGHFIRFSTVTRTILNFHGHVFGDSMSGDYGIHGKQAPWQAERTTGMGAAPQAVTTYGQSMLIPPAPQPAPIAAAPVANYSQQSNSSAPQTDASDAPAPAPLSSDQLDSLVAPIALYPDALVAQVLAAATVPDEVTAANQWLGQNSNLTGQSLAQAVDQQDWDPSVKALTQFPSVLANLATNLTWTSSLGQAFHFQQSDVMAAVQVMRARAQAAGTLQSNSQITVTTSSPGVILIQPANPQFVYVPQYNPAIVYGAPIVVPMYTPSVVFATPALSFGVGVSFGGGGWAVGGGFGWGFHAWACNWGGWGGGGNTIIFNHNTYITNNTWNNRNYNGYHPWGPGSDRPGGYVGPNGAYHPDPGYQPGTDTHYGPNGAYHPNGYFGPNGGWHPGAGPDSHTYNPTTNPNGYHPGDDTHYGPNGAYHPTGYYGPNGAYHHDVPGTGPANMPNGGNNGNHGLIGGNNGVRNPNAGMNGPGVAPPGGYHNNGANGGDNGNHGLIGGNNGVRDRNAGNEWSRRRTRRRISQR